MRLISFALTQEQLLNGSKTVTRRLGWKSLKAGTRLMGVHKAMGLKPGEKPRQLAEIEVLSVRREPLEAIEAGDAVREGFPDLTEQQFVDMFCEHMKCGPGDDVTRIEFRIVRVLQGAPVQLGLLGGAA